MGGMERDALGVKLADRETQAREVRADLAASRFNHLADSAARAPVGAPEGPGWPAERPERLISDAPRRLELLKLADLNSGEDNASARFCAALRRDHVAIVELDLSDRATIAKMWSYAEEFHGLPADKKERLGPRGRAGE